MAGNDLNDITSLWCGVEAHEQLSLNAKVPSSAAREGRSRAKSQCMNAWTASAGQVELNVEWYGMRSDHDPFCQYCAMRCFCIISATMRLRKYGIFSCVKSIGFLRAA